MPMREAACASPPMPSAIRPGTAQGKPVNRWPRSHSAAPSAAASASASGKAAAAQPPRRHGRKTPVDRHAARQRAQHEGHHPEIGRGIDEEGKADPVEGHGEIAKPEQPAGAEAAAPAGVGLPVSSSARNSGKPRKASGHSAEGRQAQRRQQRLRQGQDAGAPRAGRPAMRSINRIMRGPTIGGGLLL